MKLDNRILLAIACCLTLFIFPVTAFSSGPLRIALAFVCLLFIPGYALLSALFPKQDALGMVERIALSFGLSIAIIPLLGLALNYTPWGLRLTPILITVAAFIFAASLAGIVRQQLLPADQRFSITLGWSGSAIAQMNAGTRILVILVCLAVAALAGLIIYSVVSLPSSPQPTEFYILDSGGKAENYPHQVKAGETVNITVTVINHEAAPTAYLVRVTCAGATLGEVPTGKLAPGEKWAEQVSFKLPSKGQDQKVDFQLYNDGTAEPDFKDPLYIYIDVMD